MIVLGIGAHPDDLDFSSSGTFAKWVKEGANCYYLICTDGCKGSSDPKMTEAVLKKLRKKEQEEASRVLGLKGVFFLKYKDTQLIANLKLKREIVYFIRKLKPDIVVTFDPTFVYSQKRGVINHSDHRACGEAVLDAVYPLSRDRLAFHELNKKGLKPHKVKTLYLINFNNPDHFIDISDTIEVKRKAILTHKTQMDDGVLERILAFSKDLGKKKKVKFAEGFIKLSLPS